MVYSTNCENSIKVIYATHTKVECGSPIIKDGPGQSENRCSQSLIPIPVHEGILVAECLLGEATVRILQVGLQLGDNLQSQIGSDASFSFNKQYILVLLCLF